MGIVFRARQRTSGEPVALKTVLTAKPHLLSSIRREVQRLRRLSHPGVVRILDDGAHAGLPWYAMELLEGVTLEQELERRSVSPLGLSELAGGNTAPVAGYLDTVAGDSPADAAEVVPARPVTVRAERRPLDSHEIPELLAVARKLCDVLVYIHGEGVVHRDIKPSTVPIESGAAAIVPRLCRRAQRRTAACTSILRIDPGRATRAAP
jgi:serine/threonine protein kinase